MKIPTKRSRAHPSGLKRPDFAAIGELVVDWAEIEYLLILILGMCCRFSFDFAHRFAVRMDAGTQMEILRELLPSQDVDGHSKRALLKLLDSIDELRTKRNDVVHGFWISTTDKPPYPMVMKRFLKAARVGKEYQPTVRDVISVAKEVRAVRSRLTDILNRSEWKDRDRWIGAGD